MKKILFAALLLVGCDSTVIAPQPMPIPAKEIGNIWPKSEYHDMAKEMLYAHGKQLLEAKPADADTWCLDWANVDKASFYSSLLSNMAKYESNFRPALQFQEKFRENDGKGPLVVSRGLLQVSRESCQGYGTPLANAEQLHDPKKNLECSVRVLNKLVVQDNLISAFVDGKHKGGARYWAVLRPTSKLSEIKSAVMGLCK